MRVHAAVLLALGMIGIAETAPAAFTERVSVGVGGVQANQATYTPPVFVSTDGRYVVFDTGATNLVPGSAGGSFLRDRLGGTTARLAPYTAQAITPDFNLLAFGANAGTLVPGDTNGVEDVFVLDRTTHVLERVSVGTGGTQAIGGDSLAPQLSADGRFVGFLSYANNLVPNDHNVDTDIFVHDRVANTTERATVSTGGTEGNAGARTLDFAMTPDARFIAFLSRASNLAPGGVASRWNVYVRDRMASTTELAGFLPDGTAPGIETCCNGGLSISPDGRFVAFIGELNGPNHAYQAIVRDRLLSVSVNASAALDGSASGGFTEAPGISDDGRYATFTSNAQDLVAAPPTEPYDFHVYRRDLLLGVTERVSVATDGTTGNAGSTASRISGDGRVVAFVSTATNLVADDTNGTYDLFARDLPCGNHVVEGVEACDDGNNVSGDGCDANCTVSQCGNGIVTSGEACDDGDDNGSDGCCSASCTLVDADGDGVCDAADACTAPAVVAGKLALVGLALDGPDRLAFKGRLALTAPLVPPLDPATNGIRVQVTDAVARNVVDTTILGGAGWTTHGTVSKYKNATGPVVVKIQDRSGSSGQVRFAMKAKGALFGGPALAPLVGRIFLHPPDGSQGECGEARLTCVASGNGDRVRCR